MQHAENEISNANNETNILHISLSVLCVCLYVQLLLVSIFPNFIFCPSFLLLSASVTPASGFSLLPVALSEVYLGSLLEMRTVQLSTVSERQTNVLKYQAYPTNRAIRVRIEPNILENSIQITILYSVRLAENSIPDNCCAAIIFYAS